MGSHLVIDVDHKILQVDMNRRIVPISIDKCKLYRITTELPDTGVEKDNIVEVALRQDACRSKKELSYSGGFWYVAPTQNNPFVF